VIQNGRKDPVRYSMHERPKCLLSRIATVLKKTVENSNVFEVKSVVMMRIMAVGTKSWSLPKMKTQAEKKCIRACEEFGHDEVGNPDIVEREEVPDGVDRCQISSKLIYRSVRL